MPEPAQPITNQNNDFKQFLIVQAFLELPINGVTLLGYPKQLVNVLPQGIPRWGSPAEWAVPSKDKPRIHWVDDPLDPLSKRTITKPEDLLGVRGGDLSIEKILEMGQNQVVYCFYLHTSKWRAAFGFDRYSLDQKHAEARRQLLLPQ